MAEERIIYTDPNDGGLRIITPAYQDGARPRGDTDEALINRVIAQSIPVGTTYRIVSVDAYSAEVTAAGERTFRGAWEDTDGAVQVNMTRARVIHMDRIRVVRNAELVAKDITFMRAVEAGDASAQSTIGTEKQVLRDIPATFDITTGVSTPAALHAKWPTELPARE